MRKIYVLLCSVVIFIGCAPEVKQSEIKISSRNLKEISGSVTVQIEQSKKEPDSYVFDKSVIGLFEKNSINEITKYLNNNGVKVVKQNEMPKYQLHIRYSIKEEISKMLYTRHNNSCCRYMTKDVIGTSSLSKVRSDVVLRDSNGNQLLNISLDNLTKILRAGKSGIKVEPFGELAMRVGKLVGKVLFNIRPHPVSLTGEWINANKNTSLLIKHGAESESLIGVEDEVYTKGDTTVKLGEIEWLHISAKNEGGDVISSYSGEAKHVNPITDDYSWKSATFEVLGNILFVKHCFFANEETAIYFKNI